MNKDLITAVSIVLEKQASEKEAVDWGKLWDSAKANLGGFRDSLAKLYEEHPEAVGSASGAGLALALYALTSPKGERGVGGAVGSAGVGGLIGYLLNVQTKEKPKTKLDPSDNDATIPSAEESIERIGDTAKNLGGGGLRLLGMGHKAIEDTAAWLGDWWTKRQMDAAEGQKALRESNRLQKRFEGLSDESDKVDRWRNGIGTSNAGEVVETMNKHLQGVPGYDTPEYSFPVQDYRRLFRGPWGQK